MPCVCPPPSPLLRAVLRVGGEWGLGVGVNVPGPGSPPSRDVLAEEGGGGAQKFVYQKWPNQRLPLMNLVFSHSGHFGGGGGGGSYGCRPF